MIKSKRNQIFLPTVKHFANCKRNTTEFDDCIKNGLNEVRKFFKTGNNIKIFI